jgi:hypothetical protein
LSLLSKKLSKAKMNDNAVKPKNFRRSNDDNNAKAYDDSFINSCNGYKNVILLVL